MKKSMILFIAAAAAVMALVSCTKETPDNNGTKEEQNTGLRTLTVSFAPSTRTTLNGLQPVWQGGEEISLNGTTKVTVPSSAAGKTSFTLETTIQGDILAVYPADAWTNSEPHFTLSKQDGTFAAANICTANANAGDTELTFSNQTAVIELNVPDGTTSLTVTSLNPIGTSGQRANSGAVPIADVSTTTFTVNNNSLSSPWYVAVLPGALLRDLNFDVTYSESKTAQGGFSPNYIESQELNPDELTVDLNFLYTLPANSLHEYVTVDGKKWATMNVGATSTTDKGLYFAWGDTVGQTWNGSSWSNGGFSTAPTLSPTNPEILPLQYDAAFCNWGGAWRMPEKGDFETFISGASYTSGNFVYKGVTFPAAGYGEDTDLGEADVSGYYWSSSLNTDEPSYAFGLGFYDFDDGYIGAGYYDRYSGSSVRPLSE